MADGTSSRGPARWWKSGGEYVRAHGRWLVAPFTAATFGGVYFVVRYLLTTRGLLKAELNGAGDLRKEIMLRRPQEFSDLLWNYEIYTGALLLIFGAGLGSAVAKSASARRAFNWAAVSLVILAPVKTLEDFLLNEARSQCTVIGQPLKIPVHCGNLRPWAVGIQSTSFLLYTLFPASALIAVAGALTATGRLWRWQRDRTTRAIFERFDELQDLPEPPFLNTGQAEPTGDHAHWVRNADLPGMRGNDRRGGLGISLSGGGIRSATFALGALQSLRRLVTSVDGDSPVSTRSELLAANYISAVSGGSYIAAAFQLAMKGVWLNGKEKAPPPSRFRSALAYLPRQGMRASRAMFGMIREEPAKTRAEAANQVEGEAGPPESVFEPGSAEFDYLRRHASYLGRTSWDVVLAAFTVIRGALVSAVFLAALAFVGGRWVGHFYNVAGRRGVLDSPWSPAWGFFIPVAALLLLSGLLWTVAVHRRGRRVYQDPLRGKGWADAAAGVACAAAVLVAAGAVVPVVTWLSERIVHPPWASHTPLQATTLAQGGATGALGLLVGYLGLWSSRRTEITRSLKQARGMLKPLEQLGDFGKRAIEWMAVYGGLALVTMVYLVIFGVTTRATAEVGPLQHISIGRGSPHVLTSVPNLALTGALTVLLGLVYFLLDETSLGLHPSYREHLSRAFAVRRAPASGSNASLDRHHHRPAAIPYPPNEAAWTFLDRYGEPEGGQIAGNEEESTGGPVHFPQVIFCSSAHSSDPEDIQPGRKALPFTFSHDYVGGPDCQWCDVRRARVVARLASPRYSRDLTVQTAMAVSGAAFSSAMGRHARPANVLLALANARLGTWVVNPTYAANPPRHWYEERLHRKRRMSYLLREIFGWYPADHPLLFVTDGGHYEYLGMIELFRRRCTEIYCFDASTDRESFAASIAESIALAYEELGVVIELHEPDRAAPHSGGQDSNDQLAARIADTPVITGTFRYPKLGLKNDKMEGLLVIGKATLDPETPWELKRYAAQHPMFPYDATGDQFFDVDKFNAYTALGRHVGDLARTAMQNQRRYRYQRQGQAYVDWWVRASDNLAE